MDKRRNLTPRERECLILTSCGLNEREIGKVLNISMNTVRVHMRNLKKSLGATNKANAVVISLLANELKLEDVVLSPHFNKRDVIWS